jgi:hypothetical protein
VRLNLAASAPPLLAKVAGGVEASVATAVWFSGTVKALVKVGGGLAASQ